MACWALATRNRRVVARARCPVLFFVSTIPSLLLLHGPFHCWVEHSVDAGIHAIGLAFQLPLSSPSISSFSTSSTCHCRCLFIFLLFFSRPRCMVCHVYLQLHLSAVQMGDPSTTHRVGNVLDKRTSASTCRSACKDGWRVRANVLARGGHRRPLAFAQGRRAASRGGALPTCGLPAGHRHRRKAQVVRRNARRVAHLWRGEGC